MPRSERVQERVALTMSMLNLCWPKYKIKKALMTRYGVSARTCENYLTWAREEMMDEIGIPVAEHRANIYGYYASIVADMSIPNSDPGKMEAVKSIRKLLGLDEPERSVVSGDPSGAPISVAIMAMPDNKREPNLEANLARASYHGNGNGRVR